MPPAARRFRCVAAIRCGIGVVAPCSTAIEASFRQADYRVEVSSNSETHTCSHGGFIFASSPRVQPILPGFDPIGRTALATATPREIVDRLSSWMARHRPQAR